MIWPWAAFWARHQHASLPTADLAGLPHELNPYERLVVRWLFAEWKVALLIPAGAVFGVVWALDPSLVFLAALLAGLLLGVVLGVRGARRPPEKWDGRP